MLRTLRTLATGGRRAYATAATKQRTGHLYFDNVYPIRFGLLDPRHLISSFEQQATLDHLRKLVPEDSAFAVKVTAAIPQTQDGGALVPFTYALPEALYDTGGPVDAQLQAQEERRILDVVLDETKNAVIARNHRPWFSWRESHVFLVKGELWIEDLNRFPNNTIKVQFDGPEIPQEQLYETFRPYGKISDIIPSDPASKDLPKSATIIYRSLRSSAAARVCLHGITINPSDATPTVLRIFYSERVQNRKLKDWISSHPRIVLPLLLALLGTTAAVIFDPIREFLVREKIEGRLNAKNWALVGWLKKETFGRLGLTKIRTTSEEIEQERVQARAIVDGWLRDAPDTYNVIFGPRGSGKEALLTEVLSAPGFKNVLTIDCENICKLARSEEKLVSELATAVGYFPQFAFLSSINQLIDAASVGLVGTKTGFSSTTQNQLKAILETAAAALKSIAEETRMQRATIEKASTYMRETAEEREVFLAQLALEGVRDARVDCVAGNGLMSEIGGGFERDGEKFVIYGPLGSARAKAFADQSERVDPREISLPVVIIKNFAPRGGGESKLEEILSEAIAEWGGNLVANQIAHVIFTTSNSTSAKAFPSSKPFNSISLNDADSEQAYRFLSSQLLLASPPVVLPETAKSIVSKLGGRRTDLELLLIKLRAGAEVNDAVSEIVKKNCAELRKSFLNSEVDEFSSSDEKRKSWTRLQAWTLIKGLAQHSGELNYADSLINIFGSNEKSLKEIEAAELISIHHSNGRPSLIRPAKPVFQTAFEALLADQVYASTMDFYLNQAAIAKSEKTLAEASAELVQLSSVVGWKLGGGTPTEVLQSAQRLLLKMGSAEEKLEALEKEKARLLEVFKKEK